MKTIHIELKRQKFVDTWDLRIGDLSGTTTEINISEDEVLQSICDEMEKEYNK